jgi:hypothetical protein
MCEQFPPFIYFLHQVPYVRPVVKNYVQNVSVKNRLLNHSSKLFRFGNYISSQMKLANKSCSVNSTSCYRHLFLRVFQLIISDYIIIRHYIIYCIETAVNQSIIIHK